MIKLDYLRDYYELTKPRVVFLMLFTALIGMLMASQSLPPINLVVLGLIGIGMSAGSAAVINQLVDQKIDHIMNRTKRRPLPQGKVTQTQALVFAAILAIAGLGILYFFVNPISSYLSALTLIGYACFYTMFLKYITPQNIVIGGAAGAAPPLLGWSVISNSIDPNALILVLIIYVWTPPHFWALAIYRNEEYKKAKVPMLTVTHGIDFTKLNILLYTILLAIVTLLPYIFGFSHLVYLIAAIILNIVFLYYAIRLYCSENLGYAIKTFKYSILYLSLLFLFLLIDHYS